MADDSELLRRYAEEGSNEAFTELVQRRFDLVHSAAQRQIGDAHRARDVAQLVFADLARKASALCRHPALSGWLYTSTYFVARQMIRSEQRRQAREQAALAMEEPSPLDADWSQVRPHLDAAMHGLSTRDRDAIVLRFFEQRPYAEVAARLGLRESAAQMRVNRALEKLRRTLVRHGVTSTAGALALVLTNQTVVAAPAGLSLATAGGALTQATAAVGAGFWLGLGHFMISSKTATGILGVAAVLALGSGFYFSQQARIAETHLAFLNQHAAALQLQLDRTGQRAKTAASPTEMSTGSPTPTGASSNAIPNATHDTGIVNASVRDISHEFAENPELRRLAAEQSRADYKLRYGQLYRDLNLSPAQIERFEAVLLKKRSDDWDLTVASIEVERRSPSAAGEIPRRLNDPLGQLGRLLRQQEVEDREEPELIAARKKNAEQRDAALSELLGADGFAALQNYERTEPARQIASEVALQGFHTGSPLTPEQREHLLRDITNHSAAYQQGEKVQRAQIDWDGLLRDAAGVLDSSQLAVLSSQRERALQERSDPGAMAGKPAKLTP